MGLALLVAHRRMVIPARTRQIDCKRVADDIFCSDFNLSMIQLTALVLWTRSMHGRQTHLTILQTHRIRGTVVRLTDVSHAARPVLDLKVLQSRALGHTGRRICFAVTSTDGDKVRRTVARQAGVRVIGDAVDATLLLGAGYLSGEAAANIAFDVEPGRMIYAAPGQVARVVRNAR